MAKNTATVKQVYDKLRGYNQNILVLSGTKYSNSNFTVSCNDKLQQVTLKLNDNAKPRTVKSLTGLFGKYNESYQVRIDDPNNDMWLPVRVYKTTAKINNKVIEVIKINEA